ncbi:MAG: hypothetical protein AVDCRST_MAG33-1964 [uncultured Thermomicrobiales bacterium]|uniref:Uncharacterized protein n=1 Tax=uncultured Thermomicrobiales bacterium TaxID=1645740 RepID=A0A6J4V2L6_9BACT|nr:MAG: hypothetical protein AVDCRST_MAG33-1964 [uncultured Thermomicrobiales bacterium]
MRTARGRTATGEGFPEPDELVTGNQPETRGPGGTSGPDRRLIAIGLVPG